MADVTPRTVFHVALDEKEYNLVMLALAAVADSAVKVKPDGHHRKAAAELNLKLLAIEKRAWAERLAAVAKKMEKAPAAAEQPDVCICTAGGCDDECPVHGSPK